MSIKLQTDAGERWVEGTVFEPNSLRLVSVRGVEVEAPLGGTMLMIANDDQPGVIGEVGTILGRHGVNIANFALGRGEQRRDRRRQRRRRAAAARRSTGAVEELRSVPAIREAWVVRLGIKIRNLELRIRDPVRSTAGRSRDANFNSEFQILNYFTATRSAPGWTRAVSRVPPTTGSPST